MDDAANFLRAGLAAHQRDGRHVERAPVAHGGTVARDHAAERVECGGPGLLVLEEGVDGAQEVAVDLGEDLEHEVGVVVDGAEVRRGDGACGGALAA